MGAEVPIYKTFGGSAVLYVVGLITLILILLVIFQAYEKRYEFLKNRKFRLSFFIAHLLVSVSYSYVWRGYLETSQGILVWLIPGIFDFPSSFFSIIFPIPLFAIVGSFQYLVIGMGIDEYTRSKSMS